MAAFASAIVKTRVIGSFKIANGTFASSAGAVGGDIVTGLRNCEGIWLTSKGSAITTGANVVNETLPVSGGEITIVTDANVTGTWVAIGK